MFSITHREANGENNAYDRSLRIAVMPYRLAALFCRPRTLSGI
jgi:hypothetical protein